MTRLDLEYLLATVAHRGKLHRIYDCMYDGAVTEAIRDLNLHRDLSPQILERVRQTYETGRLKGRWKLQHYLPQAEFPNA